jgi:hypothetical protein
MIKVNRFISIILDKFKLKYIHSYSVATSKNHIIFRIHINQMLSSSVGTLMMTEYRSTIYTYIRMFENSKQRVRLRELTVLEYPCYCSWLFSYVSKMFTTDENWTHKKLKHLAEKFCRGKESCYQEISKYFARRMSPKSTNLKFH